MHDLLARGRLAAGLALLPAGLLLLLATDPFGRNAASLLAPFLVLGGIALAVADALRKE
jgi:hypothetical protein